MKLSGGLQEDLAELVKRAEEQRLAEAAAKAKAEQEAKREARKEAPEAADEQQKEGAEKGKKRRSPERSPRSRSSGPPTAQEGGTNRARLVPALMGLFQRWHKH